MTQSGGRSSCILGRADEIGTLRVGTIADIAVLQRSEGRFRFTDSYGGDRTGSELLSAAVTIRQGRILPGGGSRHARQLAEQE